MCPLDNHKPFVLERSSHYLLRHRQTSPPNEATALPFVSMRPCVCLLVLSANLFRVVCLVDIPGTRNYLRELKYARDFNFVTVNQATASLNKECLKLFALFEPK